MAPLAERNAIPRRDLDNALASVEVGKAGVETANARVESAQIDLGYCEIKAPISGRKINSDTKIATIFGA